MFRQVARRMLSFQRGLTTSTAALEESVSVASGPKEFAVKWDKSAPSTMSLPCLPSDFVKAKADGDSLAVGDLFPVNFYTPHGVLASMSQKDGVTLPGVDGYFGLKANHVPLISQLTPGVVEMFNGTESEKFFISGGFAFVHPNGVADICVLEAATLDQVDAAAVKAALATAQGQQGQGDEDEQTASRAAVELSELVISSPLCLSRAEPSFTGLALAIDDKFFDTANTWSGDWEFFELSALKDKAAGWLVNDTLVLTVDVTVTREDRFQLVTGGAPCDMILRLPCGVEVLVLWEFLQVASPFFRNALEDVNGSNVIPLDGSFGTWTYILTYLYPLHDRPGLTLESIYMLLLVVHKYDFTRLLTRLVAFVKESGQLDHWHYECATYVINWLALAERLQLDELREVCLARLRGMTKEQRNAALTEKVEVGSGAGMVTRRAFREGVKGLGQALCLDLLDIALE
ncbi:hypothetical protein FOA52_003283 [Chlamydomonas sp. UWO 241]|nr:hypothetical protein FOA52_003283 [Chlamydomonas sp. UWO 241]